MSWAEHYTYMADYQRKNAEALDMLAKAQGCCPSMSEESREYSEAFYMDAAFNSRQLAVDWAEMAISELREKTA